MKSRKTHEKTTKPSDPTKELTLPYIQLHLRVGWWSLLVFLSLGIVLESLHAFRVQWYLAVGEAEWRRLMLTLAHAHGVLIALVHIAFAVTLNFLPSWWDNSRRLASLSLISSGVLMPGGFLLGGLFVYDTDPGIGVWLVPVGSSLLFLAVLLIGIALMRRRVGPEQDAK